MQTLSIKALRVDLDLDTWPGHEIIRIEDDRTPPDVLLGHYLPPKSATSTKPLVIVFHGMGGTATSGYMKSIGLRLLEHEYPVVLWNHRGAGTSRSECSHFHHPGFTDDIRRLVKHLREDYSHWIEGGIAMVAFSLGANPMLRYLAEEGEDCPVQAAVSVSAPLDMEVTSRNLRSGWNRVFDQYLLRKQRAEVLRPNVKLSDEQLEAAKNASSVWELDDQFTAKLFDFDGAEEYYRANSAIHVLDDIRTRTLLIHAEDDPVVDDDVFHQRQWTDEGPLFAALASSGGHTGFLDQNGKRWHEACTVRFFDDCLKRRSEASE